MAECQTDSQSPQPYRFASLAAARTARKFWMTSLQQQAKHAEQGDLRPWQRPSQWPDVQVDQGLAQREPKHGAKDLPVHPVEEEIEGDEHCVNRVVVELHVQQGPRPR